MRDPTILKKFSQKDASSPVIFTGDTCIVRILEKFEGYGCLQVSDTVKTVGVFDMEVDGITSGMLLAAKVEMVPSEVDAVELDGNRYVQLTFRRGDVFLKTTETVLEEKIAFYVWLMYIKYGNMLKAMSYQDQAVFIDKIKATCGISFPVDHVVYEVLFAHLTRAADDFTVIYRNTDMRGDFRRINLSDVAHASRSTTARIIGAYFKEGINSALTKPSTSNSMIEDVLRQ